MEGANGTHPKYDLDQFRSIIREIIAECGRPAPGVDGMVPARCQGHEELRDIIIGTRKEVQHLNETLIAYMARKDKEDDEMKDTVTDLRIFGAPVSQQNAKDIKDLKETTIPRLEQWLGKLDGRAKTQDRVEGLVNNTAARYGIYIMAVLGLLGLVFDAIRFLREVWP